MGGRIASVAAALCLLAGCSRPTAGELFLPAPRNSYDFPLTVEDSLAQYDFSFFTRVDFESKVSEPLRLDVAWGSPADSSVWRETVYMLAGSQDGTLQRYRTGVTFPRTGKWTLKVSMSPEIKGLRGLGLVWKENGWDTIN